MTIRYRHLLAGLGLAALSFGAACGDGGSGVSLGSDDSNLGKSEAGAAGQGGGEGGQAGGGEAGQAGGPAGEPELHTANYNSGDTVNRCRTTWGDPNGSETVCHYPGPNSCKLSDIEGGQCFTCDYPDGETSGVCSLGAGPFSFPEPLNGRPANAPPPGQCITIDDVHVPLAACTICTNDDESVVKTCKFPAATCAFLPPDGPPLNGAMGVCVACTVEGASAVVTFCDGASLGASGDGSPLAPARGVPQ